MTSPEEKKKTGTSLPKGKLMINKQVAKKSTFVKGFKTDGKTQQFELGSGIYTLVLNVS